MNRLKRLIVEIPPPRLVAGAAGLRRRLVGLLRDHRHHHRSAGPARVATRAGASEITVGDFEFIGIAIWMGARK